MWSKNPFLSFVGDKRFLPLNEAQLDAAIESLAARRHVAMIISRHADSSELLRLLTRRLDEPMLGVNLLFVTSAKALATAILRQLIVVFSFNELRPFIKSLSFRPVISYNSERERDEISLPLSVDGMKALDEIFGILGAVAREKGRMVIAFNDFPEWALADKPLAERLSRFVKDEERLTFLFLSRQSVSMRELFVRRHSPYFRLAEIKRVEPINQLTLRSTLQQGLRDVSDGQQVQLAKSIMSFTQGYPLYAYQLAVFTWEALQAGVSPKEAVDRAINSIISFYADTFEQQWIDFNKVDRSLLLVISEGEHMPLSLIDAPTSTSFSGLQRLVQHGILTNQNDYRIENPFFERWIQQKK